MLVGWPFLTLFYAQGHFSPYIPNAYLVLFVPLAPGLSLGWMLYQRYRKLEEYVQTDFEKRGYYVQRERPLSFWELYEFITYRKTKPVYWPLKVYFTRLRYKTRFHRRFMVLDAAYNRWEIDTFITFSWKNEMTLELGEKRPLPS